MKGISVSQGIAIGRALVLKNTAPGITGITLQTKEDVQHEIEKFERAVMSAVADAETIKTSLPENDNAIGVLEIHIELLQDEQLSTDVLEKIRTEHKNANDAIIEVIDKAGEIFRNMDDEYFRAREADVQDAGNRILNHLNGNSKPSFYITENNTILIAEDISPSDIIGMDITKICGIATAAGSRTSHTAIVAQSKEIPAVVGCGIDLHSIKTNDTVIVDALNGEVLAQPSDEQLAEYTSRKEGFAKQAASLNALKDVVAITTDGVTVKLMANISDAAEMQNALSYGSEGSGLLRTELYFMKSKALPGEEEQFAFYKSIAEEAKGRPVIVRTLDIGGDKPLPYLKLPKEENPFLGYRAIRISLDKKNIFTDQLRAIVRASIFGELKIMLPMISNLQELKKAKAILQEVKNNLRAEGIASNEKIELGIMIEIPAAALMADILAKEVDFFSIGTNDLCQYTLAVDRGNEKVKHLYDPFNPGVLRLIKNVIEQGNKHEIHTGMCGELAGDPSATLLLLGMGLKEFSMSAALIPAIKNIIISNSMRKAKEICAIVMDMNNSDDIANYLQNL
jgi:phosphoenolpyruvate-protein phosphotransferase (PTS system enzyme I)